MFVLLGIVSVLVSVLLIFAVVIQNSKGGGLSSTIGGSSGASQILGARRSNEAIEKITWYLAIGLAVVAFLANIVGTTISSDEATLRMGEAIEGGVQYNAAPNTLVNPNELDDVVAPSPETEANDPVIEEE